MTSGPCPRFQSSFDVVAPAHSGTSILGTRWRNRRCRQPWSAWRQEPGMDLLKQEEGQEEAWHDWRTRPRSTSESPLPLPTSLFNIEKRGPDSLCQRRSGEISDGGAFDICCRWTHLIHQSQRGVSHQRCKGTSLDIADNCHSCACASSLHHQSIREHLSRGQCFLGILKGLDYLGNSVFS